MILSSLLLAHAMKLALISDYAYYLGKKHGIEPELILAIIKVESNFNQYAVGKTHKERGLMQLRPTFHKASFDIMENLEEGVAYLQQMKRRCSKKYGEAFFVCYNHGSNKTLDFVKDSNYYQKVRKAYDEQKKATAIHRMCSPFSQNKFCLKAIP